MRHSVAESFTHESFTSFRRESFRFRAIDHKCDLPHTHRPFETVAVPRVYVMGNNDDGQLGLGDTLDHINAQLVSGLSETPRYNTEGLDASFAQTTFIRACPKRCVMHSRLWPVQRVACRKCFLVSCFCALVCLVLACGVCYGV